MSQKFQFYLDGKGNSNTGLNPSKKNSPLNCNQNHCRSNENMHVNKQTKYRICYEMKKTK